MVLAALSRSVETAQQRLSNVQGGGKDWTCPMDRRTAACLCDSGDGSRLETPIDDQLRRAIDEDVQSEGGQGFFTL